MKKYLLFLLGALLLTACGKEAAPPATQPVVNPTVKPEEFSYQITVVDTEGKPVQGAMVSICQAREGGTCYMPQKTDSGGVARFQSAMVPVQDDLKVRILAAQGYELPTENGGYTVISNGTTELTLTLQKA